jgi:hypothetical protein
VYSHRRGPCPDAITGFLGARSPTCRAETVRLEPCLCRAIDQTYSMPSQPTGAARRTWRFAGRRPFVG